MIKHLVVILVLFSTALANGQSGYNIVWISAEDLSPRLGCYGDSLAKTPNIDKLAEEGVRYTNAYATYGVCSPSRHTLITGMYPTSTGAMAMRNHRRTSAIDQITDPELLNLPLYEATPPAGVKCFSEYFRAAGYYCTNSSKTDYQFKDQITAWDESSKEAHWKNRPSKDTPFFAVFNNHDTHESDIHDPKSPQITDPNKVVVPPYYPDTEAVRADIATQYDNINVLDQWVGKLIQELKDAEVLDNTIIIFFTDHGDGLPRAKRWVYDSGIKVPLIIRWPDGQMAGTTEDELVSFIDFPATTLAMANLSIPDYMEGFDFLNPDIEPRDYIYAFRDRMDPAPETIRAVRDDRFKYVRNYRPELPYIGFIPYRDRAKSMQDILALNDKDELGENQWQFWATTKPLEELYDTKTDPYEIKNLASIPEYFEKLTELRSAHEEFTEEYGDLGMMPETGLIKVLWPPNGEQPQVAAPNITVEKNTISINCETLGASIAYRFDPEAPWKLYTGSFDIKKRMKAIEVNACRIGWLPSSTIQKQL